MTPMPVKPRIVLFLNEKGLVIDRNNLGNDLEILVETNKSDFIDAAAGLPYSGIEVTHFED